MNDIERIQAEQAIQEAKQALRNGLREQAREMASRSLELNPQNEEPWLILAALADTQASIEYLKIALQINPDSNRAKHGMQWALERARKEKMQDQPLVIADNMQLLPATPVQYNPPPLSEEDFWQINIAKIITPAKNVFDFVINGFFTSYHQVSVIGIVMGEMHPHTYRLQVLASVEIVTRNNRVIVSYESIHSIVDRICKVYEGKTLNDLPPFKNLQPTTENLAGVIAQQLEKLSAGKQFKIFEVTLMESPTVGVVYKDLNVIRTFQ